MKPTDAVLTDLRSRLRVGWQSPTSGRVLSQDMGISERTLRELVNELIDRGHAVGSSQDGYFIMQSDFDFDIGTRHLRARAMSLLVRVKKVRQVASLSAVKPGILRLFELDDKEEAIPT